MVLWYMAFMRRGMSMPDTSKSSKGAWPPNQAVLNRLDPDLKKALVKLLSWDKADRWGLQQLRESSLMFKNLTAANRAASASSIAAFHQTPSLARGSGLVWRSHYSVPAVVFGVPIEESSPLAGKYVGPPHEPHLDLARNHNVMLLFIEPADTSRGRVITCPGASDKLEAKDWVYFTYDPDKILVRELLNLGLPSSLDLGSLKGTAEERAKGLEFYPEFDEFRFPRNCWGAVLGPTSCAKEGQRALDIRRNFRINLAGIWRRDADRRVLLFGPNEVGAKTVIEEGDIGLVVRWIDKETGDSVQVLSEGQVERLGMYTPQVGRTYSPSQSSASETASVVESAPEPIEGHRKRDALWRMWGRVSQCRPWQCFQRSLARAPASRR